MNKGDQVQIFPYGNPNNECEGTATLITKESETDRMEKWTVQFKGENRLYLRSIRKPKETAQERTSRLQKRIRSNGTIQYFYEQGQQPRSKNPILGMDRTSHSEMKYEYKKKRRQCNGK